MDCCSLVKVFSNTLDKNHREEAEFTLSQICVRRGFTSTLLQCSILPMSTLDVQQACAIYLKHMVQYYWAPYLNPGQPAIFRIPEEDKEIIKNNIFDAMLSAPNLIRSQLFLCVRYIISNDLDWLPDVFKMINYFLQKGDIDQWMLGVNCIQELIISIESKIEVRSQFTEMMSSLFPKMCDICGCVFHDQSQVSLILQKRIFSTFYSVVKWPYVLNLSYKEVNNFLDIVFAVANRPVPEHLMAEYGMELIKSCRKCAFHILLYLFHRYSCVDHTDEYVQKFFVNILDVLLKVLCDFTRETYTSPMLMQHTISCINEGIKHPFFSHLVQPHMLCIIEKVLLRVLSNTPCDELWFNNHSEFIRVKCDGEIDKYIALVMAAESLILESCSKWTDILKETVNMAVHIIKSPFEDPMTKNGALCMMRSLNTRFVNMAELFNEMDYFSIKEQQEQIIHEVTTKPKKPSEVAKNTTRNKRRRELKKKGNQAALLAPTTYSVHPSSSSGYHGVEVWTSASSNSTSQVQSHSDPELYRS